MTEALSELSHLAASGRDARLYDCVSQAHAALSFAQRGNIPGTIRFLVGAERQAKLHQGSFNDPRVVIAVQRLRLECATALTVKARKSASGGTS